jgi:hypothetical protein
MIFVCPNPIPWSDTYKALEAAWRKSGCVGSAPPMPLILSGWWYSSDRDKQDRWLDTIRWAKEHDLSHLIKELKEDEGYYTEVLSTTYPDQN